MAGSKAMALRMGTPPHQIIEIRGVRMAVVMLSSDTTRTIEEKVERYANTHKDSVSEVVKAQYYDQLLVFECLRDDHNMNDRIFDNFEDACQLDVNDIKYICTTYGNLMMAGDKTKLELITEEQLDELKKYLEETPLKDLNTVLLVHLGNCHQVMNLRI